MHQHLLLSMLLGCLPAVIEATAITNIDSTSRAAVEKREPQFRIGGKKEKSILKPWEHYGGLDEKNRAKCAQNPPEQCEQWLGTEIFCGRQKPSKRRECISNRAAPVLIGPKEKNTCMADQSPIAEDCVGTANWCYQVSKELESILSEDECLSRRPGAKEAINERKAARQAERQAKEQKEREAARPSPSGAAKPSSSSSSSSGAAKPSPPEAARGPGVQLCQATFATEPVVDFRPQDAMRKVEILGGKKIGPCKYVDLVLDKCIAVSSEIGGFNYAVNINATGWACNAYRDASCRWDFEAGGNVTFEGLVRSFDCKEKGKGEGQKAGKTAGKA